MLGQKHRCWVLDGLWCGDGAGRRRGGFCRAQRHCGNNYGQGLVFGGGTRLSVLPCKYNKVGEESSHVLSVGVSWRGLRPGSMVTSGARMELEEERE